MRRPEVPLALATGIALALGSLAFLFLSPQKPALLILLAVEIAGGREASIPAGIAAGLPWETAATAAALIELTSLFLLFPLLVGIVEAARDVHERRLRRQVADEGRDGVAAGLHRVRWLESSLRRAQDFARKRPDVDVLALCALTLMPFLPVGALTSVLVGELLRLPARWLLPGLALTLALANWTFGLAAGALLRFVPHPTWVAAAMSALLLAGAAATWWLHRRAERHP